MVRKQKRKGPKGIPENLLELQSQGYRIRFHGFWLGKSKADRMIAQWLDDVPNAAAAVKLVLYAYLNGGTPFPTVNTDDFEGDLGDGANALLGLDD